MVVSDLYIGMVINFWYESFFTIAIIEKEYVIIKLIEYGIEYEQKLGINEIVEHVNNGTWAHNIKFERRVKMRRLLDGV